MMNGIRRAILLVIFLVSPLPAVGQGESPPVIRGRLIESETGTPVVGGTVDLLTPDSARVATVVTSEAGEFRLLGPGPGRYVLRASGLGYRAAVSPGFALVTGDTIALEFRLSAAALVLDPIRVTASALPWANRFGLAGFEPFFERYARWSRSGFAQFMTRDSIAQWEDRVPTSGHMLKWTSPLVRDVDPETGAVTLSGGCEPSYYLNGTRVPFDMVEPLVPTTLEAVEVYIRPAIPADLAAGDPCGVVSYWSRQTPPESLPRSPVGRIAALVALTGGLLALLVLGLR